MNRLTVPFLVGAALLCALCARGAAVAPGASSPHEDPVERAREATRNGAVLLAEGKLERAEAAFRHALEIDPGHAWALYELARTSTLQGHPDDAIKRYRGFIRRSPDGHGGRFVVRDLGSPARWAAMLELAILLTRGGNAQEALALYQDAVCRGLGTAQGPAEEPIRLPAVLEGDDPTSAASRQRLGSLCRVALAVLQRGAGIFWSVDWQLDAAAEKLLRGASQRAAVEQLQSAVRADPRSAVAQFYLGLALYTGPGGRDEAARALDQASLLGSDEIGSAVRELRSTGKVSPMPAAAREQRAREWDAIRAGQS